MSGWLVRGKDREAANPIASISFFVGEKHRQGSVFRGFFPTNGGGNLDRNKEWGGGRSVGHRRVCAAR